MTDTSVQPAPLLPAPDSNPPLTSTKEMEAADRLHTASQWRLMGWKFRKHRLAVWALALLAMLYLVAAFAEFIAPYSPESRNTDMAYAPPQRLMLVSNNGLHLRPFVHGSNGARHPETLQRVYEQDTSRIYPIRFFVRGEPYRFWGLFESNLRLMGVESGGTLHLLGTDALGRDIFSRIVHGARISLTIGLIGVTASFLFGLLIGAISGFYGGWIDNLIQRVIEILRSFPTIPLWMGLAAALPSHWSPLRIYFGITLVLSLIGWTGLAREVRGKLLSLREEDFATAARLCGASEWRIMYRHLLPSFLSHIVVSLTLAVPGMILGETALSFLGLGLRAPVNSWGVLLKDAQNVQAVAMYPWLLTPVIFVIVTVLAFNFLGDGLRDAADPYAR